MSEVAPPPSLYPDPAVSRAETNKSNKPGYQNSLRRLQQSEELVREGETGGSSSIMDKA